ncbi:MAG: hypothetical protein HQ538_04000 [Parcubacteria group bacterium]|nr:hypothetical protein [Parcubacteria group bacterium]
MNKIKLSKQDIDVLWQIYDACSYNKDYKDVYLPAIDKDSLRTFGKEKILKVNKSFKDQFSDQDKKEITLPVCLVNVKKDKFLRLVGDLYDSHIECNYGDEELIKNVVLIIGEKYNKLKNKSLSLTHLLEPHDFDTFRKISNIQGCESNDVMSLSRGINVDWQYITPFKGFVLLEKEKLVCLDKFEIIGNDRRGVLFKINILPKFFNVYKKYLDNSNDYSYSSQKVKFDDNKSLLVYRDKKCKIPEHSKEYSFCKAMFDYAIEEIISWDIIAEEIDSQLFEKKNDTQIKKFLYDTASRINKRTEEDLSIKKLFNWNNNTASRIR